MLAATTLAAARRKDIHIVVFHNVVVVDVIGTRTRTIPWLMVPGYQRRANRRYDGGCIASEISS